MRDVSRHPDEFMPQLNIGKPVYTKLLLVKNTAGQDIPLPMLPDRYCCQVIISTAIGQSGCWGSPWCFSPFPGLLRLGIKPAVDFTAAWDPRGSARESASPHWILLLLLWLRKCRKRCLNERRQNNYLKFFASKSSYLPDSISRLIVSATGRSLGKS